jgi:hypothetical protein
MDDRLREERWYDVGAVPIGLACATLAVPASLLAARRAS